MEYAWIETEPSTAPDIRWTWSGPNPDRTTLAGVSSSVEFLRVVAFTPDGSTLIASSRAGMQLWDVAARRVTATLPILGDASLSRDGKTLAVASVAPDKGTIQLWSR